jgi:signal peptidase II
MKKYLILLSLGGFIICLDQITKIYIHTHFQLGETVPVIQNFFNITYVRNQGAAFGFLNQANETFRTLFFLSVPPIAAVIIFFMLKATPVTDTLSVLSLSSIFGGAIGNYIDRLRYGFVVDFLDFHYYRDFEYPAFNVADIAIVTGIGLMILLEFKSSRSVKSSNARA